LATTTLSHGRRAVKREAPDRARRIVCSALALLRISVVATAAALAIPLLGASAAPAALCRPTIAGEISSTRSAGQLVTVVAATSASTSGSLELWSRRGGCWVSAAGPWPAYLGSAGVSTHHVEGDDTTPAGAFALGPVVYGTAPDPGVRFAYHQLVCGDWWDEDPSSPDYNTFQHVPCGARPPFGGSSEALWASPHAYAHFLFVEYNSGPAVPGRGSAIFIHDDLGAPTHGCITLPPARLVLLLRWLRPALRPLVVVGTAGQIRGL
jgi:L,D-peptidoglycan transpeptidase YkuD (ErfK/YbiS/YcfS/YnhG family)